MDIVGSDMSPARCFGSCRAAGVSAWSAWKPDGNGAGQKSESTLAADRRRYRWRLSADPLSDSNDVTKGCADPDCSGWRGSCCDAARCWRREYGTRSVPGQLRVVAPPWRLVDGDDGRQHRRVRCWRIDVNGCDD
mmetsp:Transcript_146800/g.471320  ORF Transcript_146800/g.471320 Transcript_146800/m.471320 type:complete len:135 (-) Transcript_146800:1111-1515(-)